MSKQQTERAAIGKLNDILAELRTLEPLPPAMSLEAATDHENWRARHRHINALLDKAQQIARETLPPEVAYTLFTVNMAAYRLYDHGEKTKESEDYHA